VEEEASSSTASSSFDEARRVGLRGEALVGLRARRGPLLLGLLGA
jgi:hypothetical protein